ncbi:MAG: phosphoribosylamine--glycine ligase [Rhodothermales bacterium]
MRILVVGSGGREHALAWKIASSPLTTEVFIAPGNAGTASVGTNVPVPANDLDEIVRFVEETNIDLTVVGPEQPLVDGLVDQLVAAGRRVVGPTAVAARLEGSKRFAKDFMARHGIPTAAYRSFGVSELQNAIDWIARHPGGPYVIKADGLAAGKGVVICDTAGEAEDAVRAQLQDKIFGDAGQRVVIEDFMEGEEASVFALTDGKSYRLFSPAQDHKRIGDGDTGPNTGGMGAYAPAPVVGAEMMDLVCREIIEPTIQGMREEGTPYTGFLYVGLMIHRGRPKVVEFNCRMGDPESQVVIPMIASDFVELLLASAEGRLADSEIELRSGSAACIVAASAGYPGSYETGHRITGLSQAESIENVTVFHAGTRLTDDGEFQTAGGRVLVVTATSHSLGGAIDRAYEGLACIEFEGMQFRRDIGMKGLLRERPLK